MVTVAIEDLLYFASHDDVREYYDHEGPAYQAARHEALADEPHECPTCGLDLVEYAEAEDCDLERAMFEHYHHAHTGADLVESHP